MRYPCPCCGARTYPVPPEEDIGGFICDECWWENDLFLQSEDEPSDQNHGLTLHQARANAARCGISEPQLLLDWAAYEIQPWSEVIARMCRRAQNFQIHCWKEEQAEIALALQWGKIVPYPWDYGVVIEGAVTPEFVDFLSNLPEPQDTEIYHKKTPFFTINLDNGFWIEHYGTENNYASE